MKRITGDKAETKILNIATDGANAFKVAALAKQSKEITDSEDVLTLDKGENISVIILGKFMLYAYASVISWTWLVKILISTDLWLTPFFLILIVIKQNKKIITSKNKPATFTPFSIGSGHSAHTNDSTLSKLYVPFDIQLEQRYPSYPEAQLTGNLPSLLYPPNHASGFGQATIVVEFVVNLQYPELTLISSPPMQFEFWTQLTQVVEFQPSEYVPGDQVSQILLKVVMRILIENYLFTLTPELSAILSPGLQNLKLVINLLIW